MSANITAEVIAILARQALVTEASVRPDAPLAELGLDSLGMAEVLFALEERFDITIPFNANAPDASEFDMSSVQAIVSAIEQLIAQQAI